MYRSTSAMFIYTRHTILAMLAICFLSLSTEVLGQPQTTRQVHLNDGTHLTGPEINIRVSQISGNITVDGVLDDTAWQQADAYENPFFQHEPRDREPSAQPTKIMVLQNDRFIYFGMQAYYDDPADVFATSMRRDEGFGTNDILELLLDTFGDNRTSYAFGVTPLGAKIDAIISDQGNHINQGWDCIWYAETEINADGFAVEVAIPFKSLKYKEGETVRWGINISRDIKHINEETYLVPIPRALGHNGKFRGSLFANLVNIQPPETGLNVEIQPNIRGANTRTYQPLETSDQNIEAGLDVNYQITPQMSMDVTYNTDFAQVETDEEIVNLTRFNILLPEKREFFLQDAGLFTFGGASRAVNPLEGIRRRSDVVLFNSRSIGIENGELVPLYGGAKIAGRTGPYSVGAMNIQSQSTTLRSGTRVPSSNYTAMKFKRDMFENSNLGFMFLNRQSDSNTYNRAVGVDGYFVITPAFTVYGDLAKSFDPDVESDDWAGSSGLAYNSEWLDFYAAHSFIDSLFNPEMGFIRRGNIRKSEGAVSLTRWINNDYLKSLNLVTEIDYITDHDNRLLTRQNSAEFDITARTDDRISLEYSTEYEFLPNDDDIRGVLIPAGIYTTNTYEVQFRSYRSRQLSGFIGYEWGTVFDGKSREIETAADYSFSGRFNTEISWSHNELELSNGDITANVLSSRFIYSFSTELFAKAFLQWNDADERVSTYFLMDWIYRPKSHLYLVYRDTRNTTFGTLDNYRDRSLQVKLTYLWAI